VVVLLVDGEAVIDSVGEGLLVSVGATELEVVWDGSGELRTEVLDPKFPLNSTNRITKTTIATTTQIIVVLFLITAMI
jgi:hypothetical protein